MNPKRQTPKPGQESVWDYPRPPRLEKVSKHIRVEFGGQVIASTSGAYRVLETSHPPTYYLPLADINQDYLEAVPASQTYCEFKGQASYWNLRVGQAISLRAGWSYPEPRPAFAPIKDYVAFYPSRVTACYVGEEQVQAQEGDFYGGWITSNIVGPFKGSAGTWGW